ncbi:6-bladed beta-propeller [Puteibacter caeruleilacunae]|nr:6-bladed beta-propeller [Puteibacter caeruleilacunae]
MTIKHVKMIHLKRTILLLVIAFCFSSLQAQELQTIDVESAIDKKSESVAMSEYAESISYCPLETNDNCTIDRNIKVSATKDEIIVRSKSGCFLFDRKTGKFIRKIGTEGRGPGEYYSVSGLVNPLSRFVYFIGHQGVLLKYGFDGVYKKKIKIPDYSGDPGSKGMSTPTNYSYWKDDIVLYYENMTGIDKNKIQIITEEGEKIANFPNEQVFDKTQGITINLDQAQFYHYGNELFYKDEYSVPLYRITNERLVPRMNLNLGKYQPSMSSKWGSIQDAEQHFNDFVALRDFLESRSHLLFGVHKGKKYWHAVYDKKDEKLKLALKDEIINDIDGFISCIPVVMTTDGYWMGYVQPYIIKAWFYQHPDKASKLSPELKKLKDLDEMANPVIVFIKPKDTE